MKLVPLGDRVVLKQVAAETTTKSGIVIPGSEKEKPQQAQIIAVGPGGVGLAENDYYKENMTEEELAKVKELADKVKSGETKVVDQLTDATAYDTYLEMTAK